MAMLSREMWSKTINKSIEDAVHMPVHPRLHPTVSPWTAQSTIHCHAIGLPVLDVFPGDPLWATADHDRVGDVEH